MKYFWIGTMILCLLLAGCRVSQREIQDRTEAVTAPLEAAVEAFQQGEAAESRRLAEIAASEWARQEGVLASLLSHERTNQIGAALAELPRVSESDFLRACRRALRAVRELAELEQAVWRNIF